MSLEHQIAQDVNDTKICVARIEERLGSVADLLEKQNGRIGKVEESVAQHEKTINHAKGGIKAISALGGLGFLTWLKIKLGL